jgi:hypothetical protein
MHYAEESVSREEIVRRAHLRASRRARRLDVLVASALLLLLIVGWAAPLVAPGPWAVSRSMAGRGSLHP